MQIKLDGPKWKIIQIQLDGGNIIHNGAFRKKKNLCQ